MDFRVMQLDRGLTLVIGLLTRMIRFTKLLGLMQCCL